ncbi:pentatricopeptide repeat-containing protein [Pyrus ussuriensis x Pyrus communis]|uniref:Pentatricopeptide repeat-containing protein n=1 Tax=Pyrus ussuriensis x Pyrus communis TaxID=2448454 RepID=A0A5N5HGS1_9ROSA|nr:pentatricopeptide repeat-containing protein [Pyrus ussuriensis x Pyrus communis]
MQGLVPRSSSGAKVRAMRFLNHNNLVLTAPNKKKKNELGKLCDARKVFEEMFEPCVVVCIKMIDGFGKNGDMGSGVLLFESMPERDVVSWTSVISGFGRNGWVLALDLKGDTNGWKSWAFVVQIVVTATFLVLLMLNNAAVNGELAMEILEEFAREYVSLPFDNEKVPHVVSVAHA